MNRQQRARLAKLAITVDRALDELAEYIADSKGLVKAEVKANIKQMSEDIERRHRQRHLH
jgi:hypothetical protein